MSHSKFTVPKKKRRVKESRESPFPVPIATITQEPANQNKWFYYTGQLEDNHVVVKHTGDMEFLYKMGFFGKGTLSRSKPEYDKRCQMVTLPASSGETTTAKVVNRRYYVRHLNWKKLKEGHDLHSKVQSSDMEGQSSDKYEEYDSTQESDEEKSDQQEEVEDYGTKKGKDYRMETDTKNIVPGNSKIQDFKEPILEEVKVDPWEDTEADADFWGSETVAHEKSRNQEEVEESWDLSEKKTLWNSGSVEKQTLEKDDSKALWDRPDSENIWGKDDQQVRSGSSIKTSPEDTLATTEITNPKEIDDDEMENADISKTSTGQTENKDLNLSDENDEKISAEREAELPPLGKVEEEVDPLCRVEDEHGQLFIIEDSDSENEGKKRKHNLKWHPVLKNEPCPVKENLLLTFEESFFLAYGLGCLNCLNENQESMNLKEMWMVFSERQKSFLPCYIVYHYFRSKGWVPKSGLKFGTDYIIYKEGPPFYHGSYSVIVRMVDEETMTDDPEYSTRNFTWTSLSGLNRITEHVAKELMFCFVVKPSNITDEELESPKCIPKFKVQEMLVSRWVSSQEREDKAGEEMP